MRIRAVFMFALASCANPAVVKERCTRVGLPGVGVGPVNVGSGGYAEVCDKYRKPKSVKVADDGKSVIVDVSPYDGGIQ